MTARVDRLDAVLPAWELAALPAILEDPVVRKRQQRVRPSAEMLERMIAERWGTPSDRRLWRCSAKAMTAESRGQ